MLHTRENVWYAEVARYFCAGLTVSCNTRGVLQETARLRRNRERIFCNMPRVLGITLEHHAMMGRGGLGSPVMSSIPDTVALDGVDGSQPSSPAGTSRERRCLALFPCKPDGSFNSRINSKEEERGRALRPGSSQLKSL